MKPCQLKSLFLCSLGLALVASCTSRNNKYDYAPPSMNLPTQKWFSDMGERGLKNENNDFARHLFFDVDPQMNYDSHTVNVSLINLPGFEYRYDLDLRSGQKFFEKTYCRQSDVWKNYNSLIDYPYFAEGVIPGFLDQLGKPTRVIVFGKERKLKRFVEHQLRVRLIAAYVERICPSGNCLGKTNWLSRLAFIGVDASDQAYQGIKDMNDFERMVDTKKLAAYLENIQGHNRYTGKLVPHIQVGEFQAVEKVIDYFKKNHVYLSQKKMEEVKTSCLRLYDEAWDLLGDPAIESKVDFYKRFYRFAKLYGKKYHTCHKFIHTGDYQAAPKPFWFNAYLAIFFTLHEDGYYYNCQTRAWRKDQENAFGKKAGHNYDNIKYCDNGAIDKAFIYLPQFLKTLKSDSHSYYFADYDNVPHGTHKRLYSWIKVSNKEFNCNYNAKTRSDLQKTFIPEDMQWKNHKTVREREYIK